MNANTRPLRLLLSEIRKSVKREKIKDFQPVRFILSQYRRFQLSEAQYCLAANEMSALAHSYTVYLNSQRKYRSLVKSYHGTGERSVQNMADLVGFKLPTDKK
uniref:Protein FMC1 homolog n=1 Tax=Rhodnius prolixus TaxID=13249 RepID=T1I1N7_RHOPR